MMRASFRRMFAALAILALVGPAFGQVTLPAPTTDPAKIPSGTYTINDHSQVLFTMMHMGVSPYYGRITKPSGALTLDAAHIEKSALSVEMDLSTVSTTSVILDGEIRGAIGFNVAQFPKAKFQSTQIRRTAPNAADVTGNMTFRGVTKPVVLHATFTGAIPMPWANGAWAIGFSVTGNIKRSDFGMTDAKWSGLSDRIDLIITGEFWQKA